MSRSSEYANSVSSLYAQIGEARAREAANKGQIWGGALANIGDFVAQYPERKAKMEEIKNRAAITDLEKQKLQHQIDLDKSEQEADDRLRELFSRSQQEFEASQGGGLVQTQPGHQSLEQRATSGPLSYKVTPNAMPQSYQSPNYGLRADGTPKGNGFLGALPRPDGKVSSEISVGVNIDGKEVEIPTLVPTLTPEERNWLLTSDVSDPKQIPDSIIQKAVDYARPRIQAGKSPFAGPDESPTAQPAQPRTSPLPTPSEILRAAGPKRAVPIINAIAALKIDPGNDPDKRMKRLQAVANGLNALPEDKRAEFYPGIVQLFEQDGSLPKGTLPPAYDPTYWKFIMGTGQEPPKVTPKSDYTIGNQRFSGTTNEVIATGEGRPANAPNVGSFEDYVLRRFGEKPTDAQILQARKDYNQSDDRPRVSVSVSGAETQNIKDAVQGMIDGITPPILPGRASKDYIALIAEAKRRGYDLAQAATDWQATQKHVATLNGAQQTRMAQAIDNAAHSLDVIDGLADQWEGGKFPPLNKARLALAKNGALGARAQQIATNLEAQISDVTSELGNVYMGGNSPTDHALSLASKNLSADWTKDQLKSALQLARKNLTIRQNSMRNVGVAGASPTNPYAPQQPAAAPAPAGAAPGLSYQDYLKSKGGK